MKDFRNFFRTFVTLIILCFVSSCSQSELDVMQENVTNSQETPEEYTYKLHLNCSVNDEDQTRSTSYDDWNKNDVVYIRFLSSGSTYVSGKATFDGTEWTITSTSSIPVSTSDKECIGSYTETANNKEQCIAYQGKGTYTHASSSADVYVNVVMDPQTWRLRFKGSSGTSITLPSDANDLKYYSSYTESSGIFNYAAKNVSLTVSSGYTPYIYGVLSNPSGKNTLTVVNDGVTFTRGITSTELSPKKSAVLTIPTESNYQSLGWEKEESIATNCKVTPYILLPLTYGYATNYNVESNVEYGYFDVYTAAEAFSKTDEEIIDDLIKGEQYSAEVLSNYTFYSNLYSGFFKPSTVYYICTVAYDKNGNCGGLVRTKFTTKSDQNQPVAEIYDITASTSEWSMTFKFENNPNGYYIYSIEGYDDWDRDDNYAVFLSWCIYRDKLNNKISKFKAQKLSCEKTSDYFTCITLAEDFSGNLSGIYSIGYYPQKTSNSYLTRSINDNVRPQIKSIKISDVEEMMAKGKLMRIEQ